MKFKNFISLIIIILLVPFILELACIFSDLNIRFKDEIRNLNRENISQIKQFIKFTYFTKHDFINSTEFRKAAQIENSTKRPVVIAGCSIAYGLLLKERDCSHFEFSRQTNRTVYNISTPSASPRDILYILRSPEMMDKIIPVKDRKKVEYVIYIYTLGHKKALYHEAGPYSPRYKIKNSEIIFIPDRPYMNTFIYKNAGLMKYFFSSNDSKNELLYKFLTSIRKESQKLFPNSKFAIIVFGEYDDTDWNKYKKDGIDVILLNNVVKADLNSPEYKTQDNAHPNAKAWKEMTRVIKQNLKL